MSSRTDMNTSRISTLRKIVRAYYRTHKRQLPWRDTYSPYQILVSEFMLQQTQVERVISKYHEFLASFPDVQSLAHAPTREVLLLWQGLGYNRRALSLHRTAKLISEHYQGKIPSSVELLMQMPGIGKSTASAIVTFAFNIPSVFIETNIRRVFLHFFFQDREAVSDGEIVPLVEKSMDRKNPREWYYALMDYGAMLKKAESNPNIRSLHYRKQTKFKGSDRQIRGQFLRALLKNPDTTLAAFLKKTGNNPVRTRMIIAKLQAEGFIQKKGSRFLVP